MRQSHEPTKQPNWETKIVCECGERCENWMRFYRHRGDAYLAQVQNRDAVLTAFDGVLPGDFYSVDNGDTHFCGECGNLTIGYRHEHDPRPDGQPPITPIPSPGDR